MKGRLAAGQGAPGVGVETGILLPSHPAHPDRCAPAHTLPYRPASTAPPCSTAPHPHLSPLSPCPPPRSPLLSTSPSSATCGSPASAPSACTGRITPSAPAAPRPPLRQRRRRRQQQPGPPPWQGPAAAAAAWRARASTASRMCTATRGRAPVGSCAVTGPSTCSGRRCCRPSSRRTGDRAGTRGAAEINVA